MQSATGHAARAVCGSAVPVHEIGLCLVPHCDGEWDYRRKFHLLCVALLLSARHSTNFHQMSYMIACITRKSPFPTRVAVTESMTIYDRLHHTKLPEYMRNMKKYHLAHHYKNFELGFGVTSCVSIFFFLWPFFDCGRNDRQDMGYCIQHGFAHLKFNRWSSFSNFNNYIFLPFHCVVVNMTH